MDNETVHFGGTPGYVDPHTTQEKILYELKIKQEEAAIGKMKAFFSVDVQTRKNGTPDVTITVISDAPTTPEQVDAVRDHLWGIGNILRELYKP